MIKLNRQDAPKRLTPEYVQKKTELYKKTGKSVWNEEWLKDSLTELSNGKCAYCECSVTKESNYMEVDHFEDKKQHPDKVLDWNNLIPSCKHCNGHKSSHDVLTEPIVNPFVDNPSDHLYFQLYRYKAKDVMGENTISVLDLNDGERKLVETRFELGNAIQESLEDLLTKLNSYKENPTVKNKNILVGAVINTIFLCLPESEYAALCATVLHSSKEYDKLKSGMIECGLWTEKLESYDQVSRSICLFEDVK